MTMRASAAICIIAGALILGCGLILRIAPHYPVPALRAGRLRTSIDLIAFGIGMAGIGVALIR